MTLHKGQILDRSQTDPGTKSNFPANLIISSWHQLSRLSIAHNPSSYALSSDSYSLTHHTLSGLQAFTAVVLSLWPTLLSPLLCLYKSLLPFKVHFKPTYSTTALLSPLWMGLPHRSLWNENSCQEPISRIPPSPLAFASLHLRHLGEPPDSLQPPQPRTVPGTEWVLSECLPWCCQRTWHIRIKYIPPPPSQAKEDHSGKHTCTPSKGISSLVTLFLYMINKVSLFVIFQTHC